MAQELIALHTEGLLRLRVHEQGRPEAAFLRAVGVDRICGSGSVSWLLHSPEFIDVELR